MPRRIIIVGGPRVGKTTLSGRLVDEFGISTLHTSQDLEKLFPANQSNGENWSRSSEYASKWFDEDGDWVCEGVQMARALRKWLRANPGKPLDADVFLLRQPFVPQRDGQKAMMKGIETVFREIEPELIRRGARIQKLKDPNFAIELLRNSFGETPEGKPESEKRMALKKGFTKAEWEALPQAERTLYEQAKVYVPDGENWKLDAEGLEEAAGVKSALQKERENVTAIKKQLADLQSKYGDLDAEKAREALEKLESMEQEALQKSGDVKAMLDAANKKFEQERQQFQKLIADKDEALKAKEQLLQDVVLDQELTAAIVKHKGEPEILLPVIKSKKEVKAVLDNGKYVPRVFKDGNEDTPVFGDTKGNPMTAEQYVEQLKQSPVYARAFEPSGNGGMGAHGGVGTGGGNGNVIRLNREQVKTNSQIYAQAKEQAAKTGATIEFTE